MSRHPLLRTFLAIAITVASSPAAERQPESAAGPFIRISSYEDDPYANEHAVRRIDTSKLFISDVFHPTLIGPAVAIAEEDYVYRINKEKGEAKPFAWNPWPQPTSNQQGNFNFSHEERFPIHESERDAEGKVLLKDGLQVWKKRDLHLGMTTAFEAANAVKDAGEAWAGREIRWGQDGVLVINAHAFIDFNALYSPSARALFFGVLPYRLPGETNVKMYETASSWEMAGHESGHAVHAALKPNVDHGDPGYSTWTESFADQTQMWASLGRPERAANVLRETNGDLSRSNRATVMGEAFGVLLGTPGGMRDAVNDSTISNTESEVHDRSEVLTGALYKLFVKIYDDLRTSQDADQEEALSVAAFWMGICLTHSTDFTPENRMTLEDVAKAYLKVDKEYFDGQYHAFLVDEFTRREIFDANSENDWLVHEAALPELHLNADASENAATRMVYANLDKLGIGPDFGLTVQSVTREEVLGKTLIRVQLTEGRGRDAVPLDNHGILVFRPDGTLADYHAPVIMDTSDQFRATVLIDQARKAGLHQHGAPLSIVRQPNGNLTVEARVLKGTRMTSHVDAFTLEHPRGERREVTIPRIPRNNKVASADRLLE